MSRHMACHTSRKMSCLMRNHVVCHVTGHITCQIASHIAIYITCHVTYYHITLHMPCHVTSHVTSQLFNVTFVDALIVLLTAQPFMVTATLQFTPRPSGSFHHYVRPSIYNLDLDTYAIYRPGQLSHGL